MVTGQSAQYTKRPRTPDVRISLRVIFCWRGGAVGSGMRYQSAMRGRGQSLRSPSFRWDRRNRRKPAVPVAPGAAGAAASSAAERSYSAQGGVVRLEGPAPNDPG